MILLMSFLPPVTNLRELSSTSWSSDIVDPVFVLLGSLETKLCRQVCEVVVDLTTKRLCRDNRPMRFDIESAG